MIWINDMQTIKKPNSRLFGFKIKVLQLIFYSGCGFPM